jgi:hypothetical protein
MSRRKIAFLSDTASDAALVAIAALEQAGFEVHAIEAERPDAAARSVRDALRPKRETRPDPGAAPASLATALEPHAERMRKLNLSVAFVATLLEPGATLEESAVAMRWAGMPNKNERALTHEVLEALADSAFLTRLASGTYRVERPAG